MDHRKKRKAYLSYDYEAEYIDQLDKMSEQEIIDRCWKKERIIYATKEIRSGGQLELEIYPEYTRQQAKRILTESQRIRNREARWNLNEKNSRKMCERVINANFTNQDIWATFTYDQDNVPASMEEATRNMQNFVRRLNAKRKKLGLSNVRYVYTTELSDKGRYHHHIVMDGDMSLDDVERTWTKGSRNQVRRLSKDKDGLTGMAMYITKEKRGKGQKKWTSSRGLKKPEETVNHYKFTKRDVQYAAIHADSLREKMDRWYGPQGYVYSSVRVTHNQVNGGIYIYARMHLREEEGGSDEQVKKRGHRADSRDHVGKVERGKTPGTKAHVPRAERRKQKQDRGSQA